MIGFDIRPSSHPVPDRQREAMLRSPGFGQLFTNHMITLRWSAERGWHNGRLEPYLPFTFDPATMVFHYAQEFFEGLKAYRQAPELGITATEERITGDQWQVQCMHGDLTEAFACGTAAAITPVGRVKGESVEWVVGDGGPGQVTMRQREELMGIQYGRRPDRFGWVYNIC